MTKVELAKMIGLEHYCGYDVNKWHLMDLLEFDCNILYWVFCDGKITVSCI